MIEVNALRKTFGDVEAVRGVSFSVEPGEVFESFAAAYDSRSSVLDEDLARTRPEVVVRRHRRSVGARVANRDEVSLLQARQPRVPLEAVGRLAHGPDHVGSDHRGILGGHALDGMGRLVEGGAQEVFSGLRTASKKCTAYEHTDFKYSEVTALPDPKAGDEAVAYRLKGSIEGSSVPMTFTVVRSGSTLVAFYAVNLLGADKTKVPEKVIDAQLAKLRKAAG